MALDALIARLERQAGTAGTSPVPPDVPAEPLQMLGGTAGTAGTAQTDNGQDVTARAWLLHFANRDALEVWYAPPATHAEALAAHPEAIAAEPIRERIEGDPVAAEKFCRACRHGKRPGHAEPGYCAQRTDTAHAYGPGHPLHLLPDDGGADCEHFEVWK